MTTNKQEQRPRIKVMDSREPKRYVLCNNSDPVWNSETKSFTFPEKWIQETKLPPPQLGEVRDYRTVAPSGYVYQKRIYTRCPSCDYERWVQWDSVLVWAERKPDRKPENYDGLCQRCVARVHGKANLGRYSKKGLKHGTRYKYILDSAGYKLLYIAVDSIYKDLVSTSAVGYYIQEHRLVMAKHLNRPLESYEIVHHINGNKTDNRIENLQLIESVSGHNSLTVLANQVKTLKRKIERLECENKELKQRISKNLMQELSNW